MKRMPGRVDTPENRKKMALKEAEGYKTYLIVPGEVSPNIYEGFEPLTAASDLIDKHFEIILNAVLDFDSNSKPDSEFIEMMQDKLADFIGELTEEL